MYEHRLPVAVHVSRREAGRHMERTLTAMESGADFVKALTERADARFDRGRRLEASDVKALAALAETHIGEMSPTVMHTIRHEPTRARPNAVARELLAVVTVGGTTDSVQTWNLMAVRFYCDRKRAFFDQEHMGTSYTRHALERAIERDMCPRTDGHIPFEQALHGYQGVLAAWRAAISLGLASLSHELHLPFAGGLMMGSVLPVSSPTTRLRTRLDRSWSAVEVVSPSPFRYLGTSEGPLLIDWVARTCVCEEMLSIHQLDYSTAMTTHMERYAELYHSIAEHSPWSEPDLVDHPFDDATVHTLTAAAHDLAAIVTSTRYDRVYVDRRSKETNPLFTSRISA